MTFGQETWFAICGYDPDPLLWFFSATPWIWIFTKAFEIAAARVNDCPRVRRPGEFADLDAVIFVVSSELMPGVLGWFRDPDVAHPPRVLHPRDLSRGRRGYKIRREGRAHRLLDREFLVLCLDCVTGKRATDRTAKNEQEHQAFHGRLLCRVECYRAKRRI